MEELPAALEGQRAPNYTTTLGTIAKELLTVSQRLGVIKEHPALLTTPERRAQDIEQIGTELGPGYRR